jgi:hypothetical protein
MARFALGFFSLLFLSLFPAPGAQTVENTVAREQHRAFAEKIHIEGVENAGKLNDHLYRGTQPSERGVEALKKLGVTTIVDLRGEALAETYAFHFKGFWHPAMKEYIRKFPERLAASPVLAPYRAGEQARAF